MNLDAISEPIDEPEASTAPPAPLKAPAPQDQISKLDLLDVNMLAQFPTNPEEPEDEPQKPVEKEPEEESIPDAPAEDVVVNEKKGLKIDSPLGEIEIPAVKDKEKKSEAPATEQHTEDDDKAWDEIAGSQAKQKKAFIDLRQQLKEKKRLAEEAETLRNQLKELQSRPPEVKIDPEIQTKLEAITKRAQELEEENKNWRRDAAVYRVEKSEDYINKVDKPFKEEILPAIIDLSKATNNRINKEVVDRLALLDPVSYREELRKFREDLDPVDYAELSNIVPKYREVIGLNAHFRKNAEHVSALQAKQREEEAEANRRQYFSELQQHYTQKDKAIANQFFSQLEDKELKQLGEAARDQMEERMKAFEWYAAPVEAQAAIMAGAKNYPIIIQVMSRQIEALEKKITEAETAKAALEKEQKRLAKATPSAGVSGGAPSKPDTEPQVIDGKISVEGLESLLGGR